MTSTPAPLR